MSLASWSAALLLLLASACSGSSVDTVTVHAHGAGSSGAASGGAAGETPQAGASALGGTPTNEGGSTGAAECATADDCPTASDEPCVYATCIAGVCGSDQAAQGTFVALSTPGDCMALRCDGKGNTQPFVDPENVLPSSGCERNVCQVDGTPGTEPVAAGAGCTTKDGGTRCDGSGNCVACVEDTDCATGYVCSGYKCVISASIAPGCGDGKKDQAETDVDCGGLCSPCALSKDCYADKDCASKACDAWAPHRCLASHCTDHRTDGDESDVDCGGSCGVCSADRHCNASTDCDSGVCEFARGNFCLPMFCVDGKLDNGEADVDCGGGQCDGCALGDNCGSYIDCASRACDVLSLKCIADHCADHASDDDETDTDCGGPDCAQCPLYKRCKGNSDCASGTCSSSVPHLCE